MNEQTEKEMLQELKNLRMNVYQIATHLKHLNWNMGRVVASLENDKKLKENIMKEIKDAEISS